jgi:hypothetical protein
MSILRLPDALGAPPSHSSRTVRGSLRLSFISVGIGQTCYECLSVVAIGLGEGVLRGRYGFGWMLLGWMAVALKLF